MSQRDPARLPGAGMRAWHPKTPGETAGAALHPWKWLMGAPHGPIPGMAGSTITKRCCLPLW